ncbi:SOS response-associated peptidase [Rhodocista pekingensis]|uniref:Abasic site processing protein n=1 Tax=Rhodocista pekingensis TaxID=201185 RepID=A0ABW2KZQ3_9PROT
MCGRFVMATPVAELARLFGVPDRPNLAPRWNVAPTQEIAVIRARPPAAEDGDGVNGDGMSGDGAAGAGAEPRPAAQLVPMRWGLVPFWAKEAGIGARLINARADTLAEKPAFREALKHRRCLIPADGFYEWSSVGGRKQPHYIHRRDGGVLAFAGLWESWRGPKGEPPLDPPLLTATIITTEANATLRPLHGRMPVILAEGDRDRWLDPVTPVAQALALLRPAADDLLRAMPVSPRVNAVRNDDAACIRPLSEDGAGAEGAGRDGPDGGGDGEREPRLL